MTRAEVRAQEERVERAIRHVQRCLGTAYEARLMGRCTKGGVIETEPLSWPEDPKLFGVYLDPNLVEPLSLKELRWWALHEVAHWLTWRLWEDACRGRSAAQIEAYRQTVYEPLVNDLERAMRPLVHRGG